MAEILLFGGRPVAARPPSKMLAAMNRLVEAAFAVSEHWNHEACAEADQIAREEGREGGYSQMPVGMSFDEFRSSSPAGGTRWPRPRAAWRGGSDGAVRGQAPADHHGEGDGAGRGL